MQKILLPLLWVTLAASSSVAAPISYTTQPAWLSAVSGLQQNIITFNTITTNDQNMYGYTQAGATFTGKASNNTNYLYGRPSAGGWIYGAFGPGFIRVDLPSGTVGVAFDMGRFYSLVHPTDFRFPNGQTFTMNAASGFIGFTDPSTIPYVTIRVKSGAPAGIYNYTSDSPIIYNAYLAVDPMKAVPEPMPSLLVGSSLAAGLVIARFRKRGKK